MPDSKENFSRWSQFLRYQLKVKTYDRDKGQNGRSPGKKPDRQAEPGSQHEADRVTVLRNQEASRRSRAVRQRVRPAGGCFGRGNAPAEQAGCGHYPQAGRRSQQHQPTGTPGECRRVRTGGGGTGETQKQDCRNHKPVVG